MMPSPETVTFDAETHTYWHGMEQLPSVSEILRPLTDGYLANIPEAILNHKRDVGIAVHRACELHDLGVLDYETLDDEVTPYFEAYRAFVTDHVPEWGAIEYLVVNQRDRYAGRLDRAGTLRGLGNLIIDIKTSVNIQPTAAVQLWAYQDAYRPREAHGLAVLQLRKDATYRLELFADDMNYAETWAALLTLHRWKKEQSK